MASAKAVVLGKSGKADLPQELFAEPFHQSLVHEAARADVKARRRAMRSALSVHAERDSVAVLDASTFETPSTKTAAQALQKWGAKSPLLVIVVAEEIGAMKS